MWFKRYIQNCTVFRTYTHHDVTDLLYHGMAMNRKTWISWKQNITFLRNKKILNLYLRWHILRSYRFVAEVTCNKTLPQCNIKVIFQSKNRLISLFRFKNSISKELRSHQVYKYLYSNSNTNYNGETERHLNIRPRGKYYCLFLITWVRLKICQFWHRS